MEEWRDIPGYEGLYQVSNLGRVRSLDRYVPHRRLGRKFCKGVIMAPHRNKPGCWAINLCKENKCKTFDIHRLVALAFIPNPDNLPEVNHMDENRMNNNVTNLEWCTRTYNNTYGTKIERQKVHIERPVLQYDADGTFIREYRSATAAEKEISGKATSAINHCVKGRKKTAYGYIWKFKEVT